MTITLKCSKHPRARFASHEGNPKDATGVACSECRSLIDLYEAFNLHERRFGKAETKKK